MNKDLRDPFASFRTRVSDAVTPTNRVKFSDPSPFDFAQGQDFGIGLPLRSRPLNASSYQRAPALNWAGQLRGRLGSRTHLGADTQVDSIVADGWICVCDQGYRGL